MNLLFFLDDEINFGAILGAGGSSNIDAAEQIEDLRQPPSNKLEKLKGQRAGQHSIRVNDQWRICFRWAGGAHNVEITDYH